MTWIEVWLAYVHIMPYLQWLTIRVWDSLFSYHQVSLCLFSLSAGWHDMLLQCPTMYAGTGHSNTKYNWKCNVFGLGSLSETLCRFAQANHDVSMQPSILFIGLMTLHFACNDRNISKMANQSQPVNARMHNVVLTVTSNGCLKLCMRIDEDSRSSYQKLKLWWY